MPLERETHLEEVIFGCPQKDLLFVSTAPLEFDIAVRPYSGVRGMDGEHSVDDFCSRHYDDAESPAPDLREASGLHGDDRLKNIFVHSLKSEVFLPMKSVCLADPGVEYFLKKSWRLP